MREMLMNDDDLGMNPKPTSKVVTCKVYFMIEVEVPNGENSEDCFYKKMEGLKGPDLAQMDMYLDEIYEGGED